MTFHLEVWVAAFALGGLLIWLAVQIEKRIILEAEALRRAISSASFAAKETPFPGPQEVIYAIGEVEERIGAIAIGLADWAKQTPDMQKALGNIEFDLHEAEKTLLEMKDNIQTIAMAQLEPVIYDPH
jgi:hypothetical protein